MQVPTGGQRHAPGLVSHPLQRASGRRGAVGGEGPFPRHRRRKADRHGRGADAALVVYVMAEPVPLDSVNGDRGVAPASSDFCFAVVASVFPHAEDSDLKLDGWRMVQHEGTAPITSQTTEM